MTPEYWIFLLVLFITVSLSIRKNKLTPGGGITAGFIGCFIFLSAGFTGILMIGLFFLLGTIATSWKMDIKEKMGSAEKNRGRRRAGQVFANGGAAGIAGILSLLIPQYRDIFQVMMAASIASATADTLSSELGILYGKNFYNILSFQKDKRGENGVVSLEGTFIGVLGTVLIAGVYATGFGWNIKFSWIVIAGTCGNIADSILGATLERKHYLENDAVNFINTIVAAIISLLLTEVF